MSNTNRPGEHMDHGHLKMTFEGDGPHEERIVCPVCGFDYTSPISVSCLSPGSPKGIVSIDHRGITSLPTYPNPTRGVRIAVSFLCESGCRFEHAFQFHKGWTLIETRVLDADDLTPNQTIWRD